MDRKMITRHPILDTRDQSSMARTTSNERGATRKGLTLIELMAAIGVSSIVMLAGALLIFSGYKGWAQTYNNANCESRLGVMETMIVFGAIGRKSNKIDYRIYEVTGNTFERVLPLADPEEILTGQAVEFRYWDTELNSTLMDPATTATVSALFYLDGGQLKVDYSPCPPGAINALGHRITGDYTTTTTLAENVVSVEFSHTAKNMAGDGKGCIRMKLIIIDSTDGIPKTTIAATLMRNTWP
jgi:prepilin-type N-terminal cleavage/methylation domain-containing protein